MATTTLDGMNVMLIAGRIVLAVCMLGASIRLVSQTQWEKDFSHDQNAMHMQIEQRITTTSTRLESVEETIKRLEEYHIPERLALIEAYQKTITELLWAIVSGIVLMLMKDLVLWLRRDPAIPRRTRWGHGRGRRKDDEVQED